MKILSLPFLAFLLGGCGHHFVDLQQDQLRANNISKIELTVDRDQLQVRDNNVIGFLGSPFGLLGWLAAQAVRTGVNHANEKELDSVQKSVEPYVLKDEFARKLEGLRGVNPFSEFLSVVTEEVDPLIVGVPRLTTKFVLAPKKKTLTAVAHIDFQQGNKKAERFNKTYFSLYDLKEYGLTGNKTEIYERLSSEPNLLQRILDESIKELVEIFQKDFESNKFSELPSIGNANYIDHELVYLIDMEILEDEGGRVLLRGSKKPAREIVLASKSMLDIKD